jgi:hypothetical protein
MTPSPTDQQRRCLAYIAQHTKRCEWTDLSFPNADNVNWRERQAMVAAGWIKVSTIPGSARIRLTPAGRALASEQPVA